MQSIDNKKEKQKLLSLADLKTAENKLIKHEQRQYFGEILSRIKQEKLILSKKCIVQRLNPILVDDLLRVGGRLGKAFISINARYPIILPVSHLTELMVFNCHVISGHSGINWTRNFLM